MDTRVCVCVVLQWLISSIIVGKLFDHVYDVLDCGLIFRIIVANYMIVCAMCLCCIGYNAMVLICIYRKTFWRIFKKKSVEEFSYVPYVATIMNCMLWVFYGLPVVHKDSILVSTINGVGLVIELFYICVYLAYCGHKKNARVSYTNHNNLV